MMIFFICSNSFLDEKPGDIVLCDCQLSVPSMRNWNVFMCRCWLQTIEFRQSVLFLVGWLACLNFTSRFAPDYYLYIYGAKAREIQATDDWVFSQSPCLLYIGMHFLFEHDSSTQNFQFLKWCALSRNTKHTSLNFTFLVCGQPFSI